MQQIKRLLGREPQPDGVKGADWYNKAFTEVEEYHRHYTGSSYYFLWCVIVDRITRSGARRLIDLGCGPGQVAQYLHDKSVPEYLGVDFSEKAIGLARERPVSSGFRFEIGDLSQPGAVHAITNGYAYDTVLSLEFLEHVEFDLLVLEQLRPGTRIFATVPNFPYASHVRHFKNGAEVRDRYGHLFDDYRVDDFLENDRGKTFFLMEGVKL